MMLCTLPNILVVQLKRFDFTASGARVKLTKSVKFAEVLDVSRFCWPDPEGCGPKVRSCQCPLPRLVHSLPSLVVRFASQELRVFCAGLSACA